MASAASCMASTSDVMQVMPLVLNFGNGGSFFGETSSESSCTSAASPPPALAQMPDTPPQGKKAPARRRGKAAASPTALALMRARRSEIERNSRLRRLDELNKMRDHLLRLEWEYKRLARDEGLGDMVFETDPATSVQIVAAKSTDEQRRIHRRLAFMTQLLGEEQNQLRKLMLEHEVFQDTVRSAWRCELSVDTDTASTASSSDRSDASTRQWVHPARCYAFLRETYELINSFDSSHAFETTGVEIMGWSDKRRVDSETGSLHYGFRKQFLGQHAETLLTKTWEIFIDPTKMARLLVDPSITTEYTTLQTLNDDLLLIRRDHTHPHVQMTFLTAHVLFRLQTPHGYLFCFRTMPIPEIQQSLQPHEMWFDIHNWTLFNHMYDQDGAIVGCEVVAGGSLADPSQVTTKHWLFELIISVLRWETVCVAPLFIMS